MCCTVHVRFLPLFVGGGKALNPEPCSHRASPPVLGCTFSQHSFHTAVWCLPNYLTEWSYCSDRAGWFWGGGAAWGNRWSVLMRAMLLEISPAVSAAAVAAVFHSRRLLWSQRSRSPHSNGPGEREREQTGDECLVGAGVTLYLSNQASL